MIHSAISVIARYRPERAVLAFFYIVLAVLRAIYGDTLTADKLTAQVPTIGMALIAAACSDRTRLSNRFAGNRNDGWWPAAFRILLDWLPAILCILVYENLHDLVKRIHQETFDRRLAAIDTMIFGVQPTLWLQRYAMPWLTDLLSLAYSSCFFTPAILAGLLYTSGRIREFKKFMLVVVVTMYSGFLGCLLGPAAGPIHWRVDLVAGWLLTAAVAWAIPPIAHRWYALHEAGVRQGGRDA